MLHQVLPHALNLSTLWHNPFLVMCRSVDTDHHQGCARQHGYCASPHDDTMRAFMLASLPCWHSLTLYMTAQLPWPAHAILASRNDKL